MTNVRAKEKLTYKIMKNQYTLFHVSGQFLSADIKHYLHIICTLISVHCYDPVADEKAHTSFLLFSWCL